MTDNQGARIAVLEERMDNAEEQLEKNDAAHGTIIAEIKELHTAITKILASAKAAWFVITAAILLGPTLGVGLVWLMRSVDK